jgi:hypothetical protein
MSKDGKEVVEIPHPKGEVRGRHAEATAVRLAEPIAAWLLNGPLTVALMLLCGIQLATWIPHYLTWPWFADHDVFATLALGWEHGQLPYRDLAGNNFPGTIYLFWIVGKLFGWGRTVPFYAVDVSFALIFGVLLLVWSRRRFGRVLPGIVGFAVFLTYYLSQDFGEVAQRDWHGPFFMLSGLLLAEAYPGRWSRVLAAATAAIGLALRPQVALFLPALALAAASGVRVQAEQAQPSDWARVPWRTVRALAGGGLLLALFVALAFLPLVLAGVFDDFLRGVRLAFYGSGYNKAHTASILNQMLLQSLHLEFDLVPLAVLVLAPLGDPRRASTARVWLLAYLGAWVYKPLSPVPFPYLEQPLRLVGAINFAVLVELLLTPRLANPALRLVAIVLAIGLGVDVRPRMCSVAYARRGLAALCRREDPPETPLGMHIALPGDPRAVAFPWDDYRETLAYLRSHVGPDTKVANLLHVVPALNGPAGRLTPLPAESLAWLSVHPEAERDFAPALERAPAGTLVVWTPTKGRFVDLLQRYPDVERLAPWIRRYYVPIARFGDIEIWKRPAGQTETSPDPVSVMNSRPPGPRITQRQ